MKNSRQKSPNSVSNSRKLELLREHSIRLARKDFLHFRRLVNPKSKRGWWQTEIARELQAFYDDLVAGKRPKLVIQAPPQHGKSVQIIDFIAWLAGKNPDYRTIYTSFSDRLGIRANLRLQRLYDSEIYRSIFPGTRINSSSAVSVSAQHLRNREIVEYVGHDGFFRNTTVRGSITGESLDLGVIDDPIRGRADANSAAIRQAAWDWFTDDFFTRFSEDAGLLAILTRWHIDDPIGRLVERYPEIRVLSYPAIAEVDEPHRKAGEALFPELKSLDFLLERKQVMSSSNWLALYQQRPTAAEGNLFKPEKLEIVDAIPAGTRFVRGWDFASTADGGDWTVGGKLGVTPGGRWIIADIERFRGGPETVEASLLNTSRRDGTACRVRIPQDPGQAGKSQAANFTKLLVGFGATSKPVSGDKVTRAEPFAAQVNVGNVMMLRADWNSPLIDEMRVFPNGTHDDQVDALSDAFDELNINNFGMLDWIRQQAEAQKEKACQT
jgi:predicted phage terminase large subunit-like protein